MLKLFDTLQAKLVDFEPRQKGEVSIYACGPTVYDVPHLGHARTAITYDVITRYFEWLGNEVTLVVNITDIDDKIIEKAKEEKTTAEEIAKKYLHVYTTQMERLNIREPTAQPKATEYIPQMLAHIQELLDANMAYEIEDLGVYFDVEAYSKKEKQAYGELVHRSMQDLLESGQARIEADTRKHNPLDFALWKAAKAGEPSWKSPWMDGRPGWHIECVAMSLGELSDGFDIHGGGSDLIFPHHENERAEAMAADNSFAKYWVHSGMLNIDGEKMAKSSQNYIHLQTQLDNTNAQAFRLAVLQAHYRSILELNEAAMTAAKAGLDRINDFARRCAMRGVEPAESSKTQDWEAFRQHMDNDFSTPSAIGVIFDIVKRGNVALDQDDQIAIGECLATVKELTDTLGFEIEIPAKVAELFGAEIQELKEAYEVARAKKDYAKSDTLREQLRSKNIGVKDHPDGTNFHTI